MTQVWGWGRLIKFIDLVLAGASYSSAGERAAVELQTQLNRNNLRGKSLLRLN